MPKFTQGPWRWHRMGPELVLWGDHGIRPIVMDCARKGMQGATPRFRADGVMRELPRGEVYDHPDARLIAAAPELLAILAELVEAYGDASRPIWLRAKATIRKLEEA